MYLLFLSLLVSNQALSNESKIAKDVFLKKFQEQFSQKFCEEKSYFRSCFEVNADLCKESVTTLTKDCISSFEAKIPDTLQQPVDGQTWGKQIGTCAGEAFEKKMADKKSSTNKDCENAEKWM
ncbi:MAG: hypothetical protein M9962_14340, partial [Oligoflexia bacterium]|nr:hypothetical protein [Oligoflexia bacterium]